MQLWFSSLYVCKLVVRKCLARILVGTPAVLSEVFRGFTQPSRKMLGSASIFFQIVSYPLFMYHSTIHHLVVATLKALLTKQESLLLWVLYTFVYALSFTYLSSTFRIHFRVILENQPLFISQKNYDIVISVVPLWNILIQDFREDSITFSDLMLSQLWLKIAVFLDMTPRNLADVYGCQSETSTNIYQAARCHVIVDSDIRY
jgi:hypothetical protein